MDFLRTQNEKLVHQLQESKTYYEKSVNELKTQVHKLELSSDSLMFNNMENKTDEELEKLLQNLEDQKSKLIKILNERKQETCVICLSGTRTHVIIPCGHKLFCEVCAVGLIKDCPICRTHIQSVLRVFGSQEGCLL